MKLRFSCIGLLIIVLLLGGCAPVTSGVTTGMQPLGGASLRGGGEPTDTPTPPVSPLPTPTPTPTSPVSPLPAPKADGDTAQAAADSGQQAGAPGVKPVVVQYTVQRGDTLRRIAANFGVTVRELMDANPTLASPDRIYAGQRLTIPSR